jgi:hypothetical protein
MRAEGCLQGVARTASADARGGPVPVRSVMNIAVVDSAAHLIAFTRCAPGATLA